MSGGFCFLFLWMSVSEFPLLSLIRIYMISFRAHKKDKNKFFLSVALTWLYLLPYKVIHLSLGVCCCCHQVMSDSLRPHRMQHARLPFALYHCPEFVQTHVHWVSDAIQPSHPQSPPSTLNLTQHQGLFQWIGFAYQVVRVLELQLQHQFLTMNIQSWFPSGITGLIFCPRDFQESSAAPQFRSINPSALNLLYDPTLISIHDYWKNRSFDYTDLCRQWFLCFLICYLGLS